MIPWQCGRGGLAVPPHLRSIAHLGRGAFSRARAQECLSPRPQDRHHSNGGSLGLQVRGIPGSVNTQYKGSEVDGRTSPRSVETSPCESILDSSLGSRLEEHTSELQSPC